MVLIVHALKVFFALIIFLIVSLAQLNAFLASIHLIALLVKLHFMFLTLIYFAISVYKIVLYVKTIGHAKYVCRTSFYLLHFSAQTLLLVWSLDHQFDAL